MGQTIAILNQKGGVGKTTTTINLAASLAATCKRVLLVDLDPQGNATTGSGLDKNNMEFSIYDVLLNLNDIRNVIQPAIEAGYVILPANSDLTAAEVVLIKEQERELRLKNALELIKNDYDYILIDCPPSLNILTLNALVCSDKLMIPVQCEFYAMEGLAALVSTISQVQQTLNPKLQIEGIIRTMYDPRNALTNEVSKQLIAHFGDKVYQTAIPRNVRLAEAPSYGLPIIKYDKKSRGALSYLALTGEFIRRQSSYVRRANAKVTFSKKQATKENEALTEE